MKKNNNKNASVFCWYYAFYFFSFIDNGNNLSEFKPPGFLAEPSLWEKTPEVSHNLLC
jgi:hypothetical protein